MVVEGEKSGYPDWNREIEIADILRENISGSETGDVERRKKLKSDL